MALDIVLIKKSVSKQIPAPVTGRGAIQSPSTYSIILNLICKDGLVEVINQDFMVRYTFGDNVPAIVSILQEEIQGRINAYKEERQIFNSPQLDTALVTLKGNLIG